MSINQYQQSMNLKIFLLFAIMTFLAYGISLNNDFAFDDYPTIVNNTKVHEGIKAIPSLFVHPIKHDNKRRIIYRPVTYLTHALEYQLWGLSAPLGHLVNLLLFLTASTLLFLFLHKLFKDYPIYIPIAITLLFIVHPIHTESVANIKGRDDIICMIFELLCLYNALLYIDHKKITSLLISFLCFILAMFAKEMALVVLALLPLSIFFYTTNIKKHIYPTITITGLCLLFTVIYFVSAVLLGNMEAANLYTAETNIIVGSKTLGEQLGTAIYVWGLGLKMHFIPHPLLYYYGFKHIPLYSLASPQALISLLIWLGLGLYALKNLPKKDLVSYGILFYIITYSLFGNIVTPAPIIFAERFLFIPSIGFCIALIGFCYKFVQHSKNKNKKNQFKKFLQNNQRLVIPFMAILALCVFLTAQRSATWKDNFTLFSNDIKYLKKSVKANKDYATTLALKDGIKYQATIIKSAEKAVKIMPSSANYRFLGEIYFNYDNMEGAVKALQKALQINPNNNKANLDLGQVYVVNKDFDTALTYLEKAYQSKYTDPEKYIYLARAHAQKPDRDLVTAMKVLHEGLEKHPNELTILKDMNRIHLLNGNIDAAKKIFDQVKTLDPLDHEIYSDFSRYYNAIGDREKAERYYNQAENLKQKK